MKLKNITEWSARWSTPSGFLDAHPTVADGVLVGLSLGRIHVLKPVLFEDSDVLSDPNNGRRSGTGGNVRCIDLACRAETGCHGKESE